MRKAAWSIDGPMFFAIKPDRKACADCMLRLRISCFTRRGKNQREEWCDVESGDNEEKLHSRSISRILPEGMPGFLLDVVDWVDESSLSVIEYMRRSPSLRLLLLMYMLIFHIFMIVLFFKKM